MAKELKQHEKKGLKLSQKLDIMSALFHRRPIRPVLDSLGDSQLVEAHQFLWNQLIEIHYLTQKREFVREEVTKAMLPSATYQYQRNCDLRLDYCKGVECIWSNPICAGNKVKNNIEVMANRIVSYLDQSSAPKLPNYRKEKEEVKAWLQSV